MAHDTTNRPLILITNDDGVSTKGIHHLVDCVANLGDIVVVAPDGPRSGASSSITVAAPLRIYPHSDYHGAKVFAVSGTPVDCVKLALHTVVPRRPDLILSGINHGSNSGNAIVYSGTMGAVLEGCMNKIPSIGYSLLHHSLEADFSHTTDLVKDITAKVLAKGLPNSICLNVNFPALCQIKGMKVVRAALGHWTEEYRRYDDPTGQPFFMLTGSYVIDDPNPETTDEYWLQRQYASVVPVRPDQTAADRIADIEAILG